MIVAYVVFVGLLLITSVSAFRMTRELLATRERGWIWIAPACEALGALLCVWALWRLV